jgi:hypothetical protein
MDRAAGETLQTVFEIDERPWQYLTVHPCESRECGERC